MPATNPLTKVLDRSPSPGRSAKPRLRGSQPNGSSRERGLTSERPWAGSQPKSAPLPNSVLNSSKGTPADMSYDCYGQSWWDIHDSWKFHLKHITFWDCLGGKYLLVRKVQDHFKIGRNNNSKVAPTSYKWTYNPSKWPCQWVTVSMGKWSYNPAYRSYTASPFITKGPILLVPLHISTILEMGQWQLHHSWCSEGHLA